jgi:hypothetical protein
MLSKKLNNKIETSVLTLLTFVVCCFNPLSTQELQARKHKKRAAARLEAADSLRLQFRKAADEGRLLQWTDSLLRDKLHKGEIDSVRYAKMLARLKKTDGRLRKGDDFLVNKYNKITYDTLYIGRPGGRWTIKLRTNISGAHLKFDSRREGALYHGDLESDYRGTVSFAVAYRGIALGLAINPAKLAGKSHDNEFNLNSYSNKYGFDVVYLSSKTYHGTLERNGEKSSLSKGQLTQQALNLNFYYAFNGKRFSFPAAFSQSYVQKRSAGSFMLGMSLDVQNTDVINVAWVGAGTKMRILALGLGAGYGYNIVAGNHWLFHLSTLPTFDIVTHSHIKYNGDKVRMEYRFPSLIITGRGAAVYSWKNKFMGATMVFNFSTIGNENQLQIKRAKERLRLFYGFRF